MALTIRKRTLILAVIVLLLAFVVTVVLPGLKRPAAQATATPSPTATPVPWWVSGQRSGGAEVQGSQSPERSEGTGAKEPTSTTAPPHPGAPAPVHKVQPGETLGAIAAQHGTTVQELVDLNKDRYPSLEEDPGTIRVGWELTIR